MTFDAQRPALLVIDMQNDFVRRGAPMHVPTAQQTVPVIARLIASFRDRGYPIVFTRYVACDAYRHMASRLPWLRLLEAPVHACTPGFLRAYEDVDRLCDSAAMIDEFKPLPGETVIDKVYFSAFHGTDLERRLRDLEVDGLIVTGTITEMCVEDTARHAVHFGFPTVLVHDAVSSADPEGEAACLRAFARNYGWVMDSQQILARLSEQSLARQ